MLAIKLKAKNGRLKPNQGSNHLGRTQNFGLLPPSPPKIKFGSPNLGWNPMSQSLQYHMDSGPGLLQLGPYILSLCRTWPESRYVFQSLNVPEPNLTQPMNTPWLATIFIIIPFGGSSTQYLQKLACVRRKPKNPIPSFICLAVALSLYVWMIIL